MAALQLPRWQLRPPATAQRAAASALPASVGVGGLLIDSFARMGQQLLGQAIDRNAREAAERNRAAGITAGIRAGQSAQALPEQPDKGGIAEFLFGGSNPSRSYDEGALSGYLAGLQNRTREDLAAAASAAGTDPQAFNRNVEQIKAGYGKVPEHIRLDLFMQIDQDAAKYGSQIEGRRAALAREANQFETFRMLDGYAQEAYGAARAGDTETLGAASQRHELAIRRAMADGLLTGDEAAQRDQRLQEGVKEQVVTGRFQNALRRDGYAGAREFIGAFQEVYQELGFTPQAADRMLAGMDRDLQARRAEDERLEAQAEKRQRQVEAEAFKQVVDLRGDGRLTPDAVRQLRPRLSDTQYSQAMAWTREPPPERVRTDPEVYVDLLERSGRGEDVRDAAAREFAAGRLTRENLDKVYGRVEGGVSDLQQRGERFIRDALKPGEFDPEHGAPERLANATSEYQRQWDAWLQQGKRPTPAEVDEAAQLIVRRNNVFDIEDNTLVMPKPRFAVGNRGAIDITATAQRTREALQQGQITEQQAAEEARLIARWQAAQQREKAAQTPTAAGGAK